MHRLFYWTAVLAMIAPAALTAQTTISLQNGLTVTPLPAEYPNESYSYYGGLDAQIDPANPTANYGGLTQQGLVGGQNRKVLIQFRELSRAIGPNKVIVSATLKLRAVSGQWSTGNSVNVYRLLVPWRQGSMGAVPQPQHWACSWNHRFYSANPLEALAWNAPGASGAGTDRLATPTVTRSTGSSYSGGVWQITGLAADVAAWYQNESTNHGWVLEYANPPAATGQNTFHASESPTITLRPELVISYATNPTPPSRAVDLNVTYIERTPEYYRYNPTYETKQFHNEGVGVLKNPGYANTQKWPNNGDVVTFTAHVINKGTTAASGPFNYRWLINGQVVAAGTDAAGVAVGQEKTYLYNWVWNANDWANDTNPHRKSADHRDRWVTFEVDYDGQIAEQCENNNSLSSFLEAPGMGFYVEQSMYDYFNNVQNAVGSYSFEDFLNWHVRVWNETYLEMSRFQGFAEDGCLERVRVQKIQVVPDGTLCAGGNHTPNCQTNFLIDGEWGFRPDQAYAAKYSRIIEWGLLHECTHQLGMIDLYTLNMEAGTPGTPSKVQVKDGTPYYLTRGYYPPYMGLMGGGDTRYNADYEATGLLSGWTTGALSSNTGYRRGFYGEQLYDLPDVVKFRALAAGNTPIPFAEFKVWQSRAGVTPDETSYTWQPIFQGTADANGVVSLPNVSTLDDGFTTLTGHTLKPNPWGRINVVGTNGSLLVRIMGFGQKDYTFIRIPEINMAYWSGQTSEVVADLPVHISPTSNLGLTNIAQGKPVSSNVGGSPANAVDGNLNTRWDPGNVAVGGYLQVNLGANYDIATVVLVQNGWGADFFRKFRIEVSPSGSFAGEQTLFAREAVDWGNTSATRRDMDPANEDVLWVTYAGVPTTGRYVRITCEQANWTKLAELRIYPALAGADVTPPATVTDLAVTDVAATAAALSWTAPGDDGMVGNATLYDIRYATFPINAGNFNSATAATNPPTPMPVGQTQTFLLGGLAAETDYWVALKARDDVGNWSALSNVVAFRTDPAALDVEFSTLAVPADSGFASGLTSDGTHLYYLRRDSYQFYRSANGGQAWTTLRSPNADLGGWHGDWLGGQLDYHAGTNRIYLTHRDELNNQRVVYYNIATDQWSWASVQPIYSHGVTVFGDYLFGLAHAVGYNYGGAFMRVNLNQLGAMMSERTAVSNIEGQSPDWFSRAAHLATVGDRVYGIKNDWTTNPAGTGDRLYSFRPADFNPSIFTGEFPDDLWNSAHWQVRFTPGVDLGLLPFEPGYGSALVGLPPNWSADVGSQGGLFILAGRSPSNHEGWGNASDLFAIFDIATRTLKLGALPGVSGSGGSATLHDGAVYVKAGGNPDAPYNTVLWKIAPAASAPRGDLNCDGVLNTGDIPAFVLALVDPAGYAAAYPGCDPLQGDFNDSGGLDGLDVQGFVNALLGN